jgi:hypothetical protein
MKEEGVLGFWGIGHFTFKQIDSLEADHLSFQDKDSGESG